MLRVVFTAEDLLRVTFAREPAPMMELALTLAALQRPDLPPAFGRWRQSMRQALPHGAGPLTELVPPSGRGPVFMDPLSRGLSDGLDQIRSAPSGFVRSELARVYAPGGRPPTGWIHDLADQDREAWQLLAGAVRTTYNSLLAPSWHRVQVGFDSERAWRTRLLAEQGIRATLAGLFPGTRWQGAALELDRPRDTELALDGRGLILLPSAIRPFRPMLAPPRPGAPTLLVYPAVTPLPLLDAPTAVDPLAALLGSTRAAALGLLTTQRNTTDLATELCIAKSSASEHAKALRSASLVTTQRDGKAVWHSCTPLGLDLLAGSARHVPTHPPPTVRSGLGRQSRVLRRYLAGDQDSPCGPKAVGPQGICRPGDDGLQGPRAGHVDRGGSRR